MSSDLVGHHIVGFPMRRLKCAGGDDKDRGKDVADLIVAYNVNVEKRKSIKNMLSA